MQVKRNLIIRPAVEVAVLLIGLCVLSCNQGLNPDEVIPVLVNDTGVNVTVSLDPNGGFWNTPEQTDGKKIIGNTGKPLVFTDTPQRNDGMVFNGWNTAGGKLPETFPARKAVYKAQWRSLESDEAFYTVEHYQENANDSEFTLKESETQGGTVGSVPNETPKTYEGFAYNARVSNIPAAIAADGSTKVILKYTRKQVTLTFNLNGGTTTTPFVGGNSLIGKYGATLPPVAAPIKSGKIFDGWNIIGGTLPATFPLDNTEYIAFWRDAGTSPPPAEPVQNLVQNADFSKLKSASGTFAGYWSSGQSPASWNTWASVATTAGAVFKVENRTFTITAGVTKLTNAGIQQPITLPDVKVGTKYILKAHIKLMSSTGAGGNGLIKLQNKWLLSQGGEEKDFECEITVVEGNKIRFKDKDNKLQTVTLSGTNQIKIDLFGYNLQNKSVSFSNISLTKE